MATRGKYLNNRLIYSDDVTGEILLPVVAIVFDDEFIGPGHLSPPTAATPGYPWIAKTVKTAGTPSVGAVANGAGGQMKLAIDATSEKQEASLYMSDQLVFDATKLALYQTRIQLPVLPTAGTEMVFGLGSAWIDGPDNQARYARFTLRGNGTLLCELLDGVNGAVSISSGLTITTTAEWHELAIDFSNINAVQFYIDGNLVSLGTAVPFAGTGGNAILQAYHSVYKSAGASVGSAVLDFVSVSANRV
jgi:hypothetical protein